MHLFHIPQWLIRNRNVHISVLNGVLWDTEQVHCGICDIGLLGANNCLAHWGQNKMAAIFQTTFSNAFYGQKMWLFGLDFNLIDFWVSGWQKQGIGSGNGSVLDRRQAINWTDVVSWRSLHLGSEQNDISIEFELGWKNHSWNGPPIVWYADAFIGPFDGLDWLVLAQFGEHSCTVWLLCCKFLIVAEVINLM